MASIVEKLNLRPDEFAFYFEAEWGVEVDALANFLKRASTVARSHGAELRVVGLREGSLAVILRAIKKSKIVENATKEFVDKPLEGGVKVTTLVGAIAAAIVYLMLPGKSGGAPIATLAPRQWRNIMSPRLVS